MDQPTLASLAARLERVEKQNRRLKALGLVAAALMASVFLMGQARPQRSLETENLTIRSPDGRPVASLFADRQGFPRFWMLDPQGAIRLSMSVVEDGTAYVTVWSSAPFGSDQSAQQTPRSYISLSAGYEGPSRVSVTDQNGREIWTGP